MVAIMEILPCFSSTDRRRLKLATSPSAVNPAGSQKPTGSWHQLFLEFVIAQHGTILMIHPQILVSKQALTRQK